MEYGHISIPDLATPESRQHYEETIRLLQRVHRKVGEEEHNRVLYNQSNYYIRERAERYTGFRKAVIQKLKTDTIPVDIADDIMNCVDRSVIYYAFTNICLLEEKLPCTRELFNEVGNLYPCLPVYLDVDTFRKILVKCGYIWKRKNRNNFFVVENPTVTFERYSFLKKIDMYRKEPRPIFYISESFGLMNQCEDKAEDMHIPLVYAVSRDSLIPFKSSSPSNMSDIEKWLVDEISIACQPASVLVFTTSMLNNKELVERPNEDSTKMELVKWLEYHDIVCNIGMSKVELLTFIDEYTESSEKLYKIDTILKLKGFTVLRLPECIDNLTPANYVEIEVNKNISDYNASKPDDPMTVSIIKDMLSKMHPNYLKQYDEMVASEETNIREIDTKLDKILDDLMYKSLKYQSLKIKSPAGWDSDLPEPSDSE